MDEVGFIVRLLTDQWTTAGNSLVSSGAILSAHNVTPRIVDVRSIKPNEGRRVDADSFLRNRRGLRQAYLRFPDTFRVSRK